VGFLASHQVNCRNQREGSERREPDSQYNAAGNALVASAVIQSLQEEPPVKQSPR
jgi:hypothetical protein